MSIKPMYKKNESEGQISDIAETDFRPDYMKSVPKLESVPKFMDFGTLTRPVSPTG